MEPDPDVEGVLTAVLHHVLVGTDAPGLQGFGRQLLPFIRHKMDASRELVNQSPLATQVKDTDLGVWRKEKKKLYFTSKSTGSSKIIFILIQM